MSCRPSNSPVGTIRLQGSSMAMGSCRPSNSPVGTIAGRERQERALVLPAFQFPSWYNDVVKAHRGRIVLPAFQFPSWYNLDYFFLTYTKVLPAFQFPSWYNAQTKTPPANRGFLVWTEIKMRFGAGKVALRAPFSENRSQKKGLPANTRGADGLTLRVIA